jgi:trimethyllysine dioxygenase
MRRLPSLACSALLHRSLFLRKPLVRRHVTTLTKIQRGTGVLGVSWRHSAENQEAEAEAEAEASFSYNWLRDNCPCPECLHHQTFQRQVDTLQVLNAGGMEPRILDVRIADDGRRLRVTWDDGDKEKAQHHTSVFPTEWLVAKATKAHQHQQIVPSAWDSERIMEMEAPEVSYKEVMSKGRHGVVKWLRLLHMYGFSIITDTPATAEATHGIMAKLGPPKNGLFGLGWDFTVNAEKQSHELEECDTAYTSVTLLPHSDGCYCVEPPGLQSFHILEHTGQGGETILVDGFNVAARLRTTDHDAFRYLANTPITFHYRDPSNFLEARQKVITLDDDENVMRFIYNNDDRSPTYFTPQEADRHYSAIRALLREIRSPSNHHMIKLSPGHMLVTNNWRVMHGRTAFTGSRRLSGSYLSMDHFWSSTRTLLQVESTQM